MNEAILAVTVKSHFKGHVYGEKGTQVTVMADRKEVLIVEDRDGNRFPVKRNELILKNRVA